MVQMYSVAQRDTVQLQSWKPQNELFPLGSEIQPKLTLCGEENFTVAAMFLITWLSFPSYTNSVRGRAFTVRCRAIGQREWRESIFFRHTATDFVLVVSQRLANSGQKVQKLWHQWHSQKFWPWTMMTNDTYSAGQKVRTFIVMNFLWPPWGRGANFEHGVPHFQSLPIFSRESRKKIAL